MISNTNETSVIYLFFYLIFLSKSKSTNIRSILSDYLVRKHQNTRTTAVKSCCPCKIKALKEHGIPCNPCQTQENLQPVQSAGKPATCVKRGKKLNSCQTREKAQLVSNAGKSVTRTKRGTKYNSAQAREKVHIVSSAGKRV